MAQNIYDDPTFFAGYSKLPRSVEGLDGAAEWPTLRAMLPDLNGRAVVDLGCGFGWFCRWARARGAVSVLGLDISDNMLTRARAATPDAAIIYQSTDLETVTLPIASFDLAYASLVLHYVRALDRLLAIVSNALIVGGDFVFSVEHPIFTAPARPGWVTDDQERRIWPVDSYLAEGPRETDWLTKGVIKQHRTVAHYVNALLRHGLVITRLEEWGPDDAQIEAHPEWADERQRPSFLLVSARRGT